MYSRLLPGQAFKEIRTAGAIHSILENAGSFGELNPEKFLFNNQIINA
jgi:hypothetical protein